MGVAEQIERRLAQLGLPAAVEEDRDAIVVTGMVMTDEERRAIIQVAEELAPAGMRVEDNIETGGIVAEEAGDLEVASTAADDPEPSIPGTTDEPIDTAADFTDQRILKNPLAASGPSDNIEDDHVAEGDVVYVPPTDPVMSRDNEVLGGFGVTSMDHLGVERSVGGELSDSAIEDAIRRELAEDSATNGLEIEVEVSEGIVTLRGRVSDILDIEAAEEVAARVPGVIEVREELEADNL